MLIISATATLFIVIATALPLLKHTHWLVRGMDFPRLQIASIAMGVLIVEFIFLDLQRPITGLLIATTALCFFWQLWWILPYTLIWPKEVKATNALDPNSQLSVITANVLKTNRNSDALIDIVAAYKPDILVTLESDTWWQNRLKVLEADMPYSVKCPLDNLYGMHVYSRLPFSEEKISYLVEKDIPSIHLALELRTGDKVRMHFVHPAPPSPTENAESTERDAELITIARSIAETAQAVIVTGDLNDVAWSATTRLFRKISGLLDPRVGRGMFNTFHAAYPFLRWPLDHIFHSSHFTVKNIQRLPSMGSDHFPLFTLLVFNPAVEGSQKGLTANHVDHAQAKTVSEEKGARKQDVPTPNK
ncbi:endonuclease/exonuclease/phosphatase family protein [Dasania marina]|uniref:endonuclease/exonuclease/phosphatase family protein n=1 Tax=Dasania marina TaxID=471499 RepID=UPI000475BC77|nr:endonuclease/exonuclease/phosphatase family protein [Dasania marina]